MSSTRVTARMRWVCAAPIMLALTSHWGCQPIGPIPQQPATPSVPLRSSDEVPARQTSPAKPVDSPIRFEIAEECGIDFVYYGNPSSEHPMTEQNGGGVAVLDYDRNGRPDLFFTNGDHFIRPAHAVGAVHQLYRNRVAGGDLRFDGVGPAARVAVSGFGMGAVAGDYDNDGFADLFICYFGRQELWHNEGDGTFENVSATSGIHGNSWSASAAFADLDEDGDLDLYVTNYVDYDEQDPPCFVETSQRIQISCGPIGRKAQPDQLWENLGDGAYRDASSRSGIHAVPAGKGLAVEIVDLDGDQRLDIYVANDTTENFLFLNRGELTFEEVAVARGAAVGQDGTSQSSMGIACADFDGDSRFDLFVTNFESATKDFYLNVSADGFLHSSAAYGLDLPSRPMLNFGTIAADFDLDQWPDLFVANGHIWDLTAGRDAHQYQMPPQLFRNRDGQRFDDVSATAGGYFEQKWLGRAASVGDFDNDGDADLVVGHQGKPAILARNTSRHFGRSLSVELIGRTAAREPLGVTLDVYLNNRLRRYHVPAGGSYQAGLDPRVIIATGDRTESLRIVAHWNSSQQQAWTDLPVSGQVQLVQGQSLAVIGAPTVRGIQ